MQWWNLKISEIQKLMCVFKMAPWGPSQYKDARLCNKWIPAIVSFLYGNAWKDGFYTETALVALMNVSQWDSIQSALRWRHNDHAGVSNHQPHGCLLNRLFRLKSKITSKLRVTGLCAGNSPGTGEFPAQMASYAENVSIWWRHHEKPPVCCVSVHNSTFSCETSLWEANTSHKHGGECVTCLCMSTNVGIWRMDVDKLMIN